MKNIQKQLSIILPVKLVLSNGSQQDFLLCQHSGSNNSIHKCGIQYELYITG